MTSTRIALILGLLPGVLLAQGRPASKPTAPRIIFVIDVETEEPLVGAEVRDFITGNSMKTNQGGAVGLLVPAFVKRDGAMIEVRMSGYLPSARIFVDPTPDEPLIFALLRTDSPRARAVVRKRTDSTAFQIEVLDETGAPMADAIIAVVRSVSTALASAVSDSTGVRLTVPAVTGDVQITVQKLGYAPYRQFYRLSSADTVVAQIAMQRLAQQLPGVTVVAKSNVKRRIYHVNENEIANSNRNLMDALDVIRKLRPTMFGDRTRGMEGCGVAAYIYVNGRRIHEAPQRVDLKRLPANRLPARSGRGNTGGRPALTRPMTPSGEAAASEKVRGVLASIQPEHVAEMTYLDCFDTSVPGLRTNNAIYVVLKLGVEYDEHRGSRLAQDRTRRK